ncbi:MULTISPECIES: HlyD family secretion protein [Enterobacterales]|uniref:HlyD family secretion protein n=1 Tax=Enterobacterales TaxID=91347 RepID=UPI002EDA73B8
MSYKLYRKEAIEHKKNHWKGKALLLAGLPSWLIMLFSFIFLTALLIALFFCHYTQRIDVRGEVITLPHSINVFAPQQGFVVHQWVKVGDLVSKGDKLYELDISRTTINGNVSDTTTTAINEKIDNANEIINKLIRNKQETQDTLNAQLENYNASLKETAQMLDTSRRGLNKMRESLANYDGYLKQGLVNKDQYNYQHSLYFQQQSSYQSLASQKMQLESQLTQLKSDIVTKSADFDNQISSYKNQISDFKNQIVESNANGNLIIKATTAGKVESLSVTSGQMVDKGSSLAQIKPIGNVEYYLVLWLPNNSLPYVSAGDSINIRYDAFPSEKFGQFPGIITSISSIPATRQEMAEYSNFDESMNQQNSALYKCIVSIKHKSFSYNKKTLSLSNGLKAQAIVFLEERPLYMWMFTPFYNIAQSVNGPINEL